MESQERSETNEVPERIDVPPGQELSAYSNLVFVRKPGEMVHIDFAQADVGAEHPPGSGQFVARVVMQPALAQDLADELSKRLSE
jgi:hypothetical protein